MSTTAATHDATVDPALLAHFHEHGYAVLEDALSPQLVEMLLAAIDRVRGRLEQSAHRKDVFGLDVRPVVLEDDAFLQLMEHEATFPAAVRMLNHFNLQLTTSHLIMVPPNPENRNIGWHFDGGHPQLPNVPGVIESLKIGYFLSDLPNEDMGNLMVVPGSHKDRELARIKLGQRDPETAIQIKCKPGTAVFFGNRTFHAGAPNLSDRTRIVLYFGYGYRWHRPIDYDRMPDDLLARCTPIGKQLLGVKSTHLGYHIPRDEDCPLKAWFAKRFGETWMR